MSDRSRLQYDLVALQRGLPHDRAELFLSFVPWKDDSDGWLLAVKELLSEAPGRSVVRTVWDKPENHDERVLIDVVECTSAEEALEALVDRLAWNQLAKLEEGPRGLGYAAFMHPEGVPPAILFSRGNLCIAVVSFGREPVPVKTWVERLNSRLSDRPITKRTDISLRVEDSPLKAGQASTFIYTLPWRYGEEGYLKFFITGGILVKSKERLTITRNTPGEILIEAYLLEPGREPHTGYLNVKVE